MSDVEDEAGEQPLPPTLLPKEVCRHTFKQLKEQFKYTDAVLIEEPPEMRALGKAAECCEKAVRERKPQALKEAQKHVQRATGWMLSSASAAAEKERTEPRLHRKDGSKRLCQADIEAAKDLQSWRPDRRKCSNMAANEAINSPAEPGPDTEDPCVRKSSLDQTESQKSSCDEPKSPFGGWSVRKVEADALVKDGNYFGALTIYDLLLEEVDTEDVGSKCRAALLCNTALCCLKLSVLQPKLALAKQLLRRTLRLCDEAVQIDSSNAKAHFRRGCALEASERYAEAYEAYEKASRYEPGDPRIRAGLTRVVRYLRFEYAPVQSAKAAAKEEVARRAKNNPTTASAASRFNNCCRCREIMSEDGYFAAPCDHGPFCRQCKAWIEQTGQGVPLCPVCKQFPPSLRSGLGVVERWLIGDTEVIKPNVPATANQKRVQVSEAEGSDPTRNEDVDKAVSLGCMD